VIRVNQTSILSRQGVIIDLTLINSSSLLIAKMAALFIHEFESKFSSKLDFQMMATLLDSEPLLQVLYGAPSPTHEIPIFAITNQATIIHFVYNLKTRRAGKLVVKTFIKDLVSYKVMKVATGGHRVLTMLIEHDCLCQIQISP